MRRSSRETRDRLQHCRGNDRCPICLRAFDDSVKGREARLEHVPPKSWAARGLHGITKSVAVCLTCDDCNKATGRIEEAVVDAKRGKVQLDFCELPGLAPIPTHTAYFKAMGRNLRLNVSPRMPSDKMAEAMAELCRREGRITFRGKAPTPHTASVPLLKAAYLTVVSVLGELGYRYAESEALGAVRRQIQKPSEEVIPHFAFRLSGSWPMGFAALACRKPTCWVVGVGKAAVVLPPSWDQAFYGRVAEMCDSSLAGVLIGGPVEFGSTTVESVPLRDGVKGEDQFGFRGTVNRGGAEKSAVVVDCAGPDVTLLFGSDDSVRGDVGCRAQVSSRRKMID